MKNFKQLFYRYNKSRLFYPKSLILYFCRKLEISGEPRKKKNYQMEIILKKIRLDWYFIFSVKGTISLIAIIWGANALKGCM
jgi:hypothetical protein